MIAEIFLVLTPLIHQYPYCLIRIIENNCITNSEDLGSYGNKIVPGQWYLKWHFWKECIATTLGILDYTVM